MKLATMKFNQMSKRYMCRNNELCVNNGVLEKYRWSESGARDGGVWSQVRWWTLAMDAPARRALLSDTHQRYFGLEPVRHYVTTLSHAYPACLPLASLLCCLVLGNFESLLVQNLYCHCSHCAGGCRCTVSPHLTTATYRFNAVITNIKCITSFRIRMKVVRALSLVLIFLAEQ